MLSSDNTEHAKPRTVTQALMMILRGVEEIAERLRVIEHRLAVIEQRDDWVSSYRADQSQT